MKILLTALALGAGFGAATSLVNAAALHTVDLESRAATTSGVSAVEVMSVLLDSGWAWAGSAVAVGWLVTRGGDGRPAALARGAAAAALALLAATAAYSLVDTVRTGNVALSSWYESEPLIWWVTGVIFGAPLGAVGACVDRPGLIGLLARSAVPVGAAVQMIVLPARQERGRHDHWEGGRVDDGRRDDRLPGRPFHQEVGAAPALLGRRGVALEGVCASTARS